MNEKTVEEKEAPTLLQYECVKCGKKWFPRKPDPALCPGCKTAYWKEGSRDENGKIL